jgi:uncharacterized protein (TIGR03000 family)
VSLSHTIRLAAAAVFVALAFGAATAAPPGRPGGAPPARPASPPPAAVRPLPPVQSRPIYLPPVTSGYRPGVSVGISIAPPPGIYTPGLYGPLTYGLGGSPFGYGGYSSYGAIGYGPLGYGYPNTYSIIGVPTIPRTYSVPITPIQPYQPLPPISSIIPEADPMPLPLPPPGAAAPGAAGEANTAKITVISNETAKVTFDGIESEQTGSRRTFTTRPIAPGVQIRVRVQVDSSTISIGVKAGEKATVDMRK